MDSSREKPHYKHWNIKVKIKVFEIFVGNKPKITPLILYTRSGMMKAKLRRWRALIGYVLKSLEESDL